MATRKISAFGSGYADSFEYVSNDGMITVMAPSRESFRAGMVDIYGNDAILTAEQAATAKDENLEDGICMRVSDLRHFLRKNCFRLGKAI